MPAKYTPGCYVDGHHGIYATDEIVNFARAHGAVITRDCDCDHEGALQDSEFASCEYRHEYEEEADEYMQAHYPHPRASWGRNESGDWGLWEYDDDDNGEVQS